MCSSDLVRSGQITASEGARILGISRKTYYQWEKRGLAAMMEGLEEQPPGRPTNEKDPEKEALQRQIAELKKKLEAAEQTAALRAALLPIHPRAPMPASKKRPPTNRVARHDRETPAKHRVKCAETLPARRLAL